MSGEFINRGGEFDGAFDDPALSNFSPDEIEAGRQEVGRMLDYVVEHPDQSVRPFALRSDVSQEEWDALPDDEKTAITDKLIASTDPRVIPTLTMRDSGSGKTESEN